MVKVYNKETNEFLGRISIADLEFLGEHLEGEGLEDRDYYFRRETFESMKAAGASPHLVEVLEGGLRNLDVIEIRWEREKTDE